MEILMTYLAEAWWVNKSKRITEGSLKCGHHKLESPWKSILDTFLGKTLSIAHSADFHTSYIHDL